MVLCVCVVNKNTSSFEKDLFIADAVGVQFEWIYWSVTLCMNEKENEQFILLMTCHNVVFSMDIIIIVL